MIEQQYGLSLGLSTLSDKELLAEFENHKAKSDVVSEILRRWTEEQEILNRELESGSPVFYVDYENQTILPGVIEAAAYENGVLDSLVIDWLDDTGSGYSTGVIDWSGESKLFYAFSERAAKLALMKGLATMQSESQKAKPFFLLEQHSFNDERPVHGPFRNHLTAMQNAREMAESTKNNSPDAKILFDETAGKVEVCIGENKTTYLVIRV